MSISGAVALINLQALQHNLSQVCKLAPHSSILAMIKSDGYGYGLVRMAEALSASDAFGVACVAEAKKLREAGIKQRIVVMRGFLGRDELQLCSDYHVDVVVQDQTQVEIFSQIDLVKPIDVWLKIDTGMHRLGFHETEVNDIYYLLSNNKNIQQPINLMTHLAEADDLQNNTTNKQIDCFNKIVGKWSNPKSIANSAGIIAWPNSHADWVRPGIMLYGVSPFGDKIATDFSLLPVMTLKSNLISVKQLRQGDKIGYGGTWSCPHDMTLGVVAIGYGDGYSRHSKNATPVLVNGVRCPMVGRVSMDMITIDLTNCAQAKCGDEVILWGADLPIEEVARYADTIAYELLTRLTKRVVVLVSD